MALDASVFRAKAATILSYQLFTGYLSWWSETAGDLSPKVGICRIKAELPGKTAPIDQPVIANMELAFRFLSSIPGCGTKINFIYCFLREISVE